MKTSKLKKCFIHNDRPAVSTIHVPCAPGGGLLVCKECAKPENLVKVFEAHKEKHWARIMRMKHEQRVAWTN